MKTYFGMTFVGWSWIVCAAFGIACWVPVIKHVVVPAVRAVVG